MSTPDSSGGQSAYYTVEVLDPATGGRGYAAECLDIIEALGMDFAEGEAFKALWRRAAARHLGIGKLDHDETGLYDAEKVQFYGGRLVAISRRLRPSTPKVDQ